MWDVQSLEDLRKHPEYLALGDKKYTACSRISDMYDLQSFLRCGGQLLTCHVPHAHT